MVREVLAPVVDVNADLSCYAVPDLQAGRETIPFQQQRRLLLVEVALLLLGMPLPPRTREKPGCRLGAAPLASLAHLQQESGMCLSRTALKPHEPAPAALPRLLRASAAPEGWKVPVPARFAAPTWARRPGLWLDASAACELSGRRPQQVQHLPSHSHEVSPGTPRCLRASGTLQYHPKASEPGGLHSYCFNSSNGGECRQTPNLQIWVTQSFL